MCGAAPSTGNEGRGNRCERPPVGVHLTPSLGPSPVKTTDLITHSSDLIQRHLISYCSVTVRLISHHYQSLYFASQAINCIRGYVEVFGKVRH